MNDENLKKTLDELIDSYKECEWLEFKVNYVNTEDIGKDISALSNSARLHGRQQAYLIYGIDDKTHQIAGTKFKPKHRKIGNEELEHWLSKMLSPRIDFRIHEFNYKSKPIAIFKIDPAKIGYFVKKEPK